MSESNLWKNTKNGMSSYWRAKRIETAEALGVPDVNYLMRNGRGGWIELKFKTLYPIRISKTPVRLNHFTSDQKNWIFKYGEFGGDAWVLLQVKNDFYLFSHVFVRRIGEVRKEVLEQLAVKVWKKKINYEELKFILESGSKKVQNKFIEFYCVAYMNQMIVTYKDNKKTMPLDEALVVGLEPGLNRKWLSPELAESIMLGDA
jgi:hypothetical protein